MSPPPEESATVEDVLVALGGPTTLELLGIALRDLQLCRADPDLFETLKITREILLELRSSGVLAAFLQLPKPDQADFLRWIAMMDDPELRRARTGSFVEALEGSPLGSSPDG